MGERFHGMEEVKGSNPLFSTKCSFVIYVYILRSLKSGRFYVGISERPDERLSEHNRGQTRSTRGRGPWEKVWSEGHGDLASARLRELEIKAWKSRPKIELLLNERASR